MSLRIIRVFVALGGVLAVGWASASAVPRYAAQGDNTARLRLALSKGAVPQTAAGDGMSVYLQPSEDCATPSALGAVYTIDAGSAQHDSTRRNHRKAGKLGMPLGEYDGLEVKELLIDAGPAQRLSVQFSVLQGGPFGAFTRCNIALEQDFEAGKDYEILGRFDDLQNCSAVVNELVSVAETHERQPLATVTNVSNPLDERCFVKH